MQETTETGSQTVESQNTQETAVSDAFEVFGLNTPDKQETAAEAQLEVHEGEETDAPAIEQQTEPKRIKVKHNKEEIEVDVSDDKLPEYVQKALALDKERERKSQLEKNLERAAKLAGFDKADDYLASLDKLEQDAKQREQDRFKDLRQQLREDAEDAGLDPEKFDAYLDNHPLLQEANKAIAERDNATLQQQQEKSKAQWMNQWESLYKEYPELRESASAFTEDGAAPVWYTPEMQARISRGYDPIDAYELAHKSTISDRNKQMARQQAIKEQRLGLRAQVEAADNGVLEPEVPADLSSAFALFGLDQKSAKKYVKK